MEETITCHLCKGKAKLKYETLKLDEGRIQINNSSYYECEKCGEEFSTDEQMKELDKQINKKFVFKRPLINAGRSLAITIPADIIENYGLKKGTKIDIIPENKNQIILQIR
jgi:YgiT-type zinc finger domain-containing protein